MSFLLLIFNCKRHLWIAKPLTSWLFTILKISSVNHMHLQNRTNHNEMICEFEMTHTRTLLSTMQSLQFLIKLPYAYLVVLYPILCVLYLLV